MKRALLNSVLSYHAIKVFLRCSNSGGQSSYSVLQVSFAPLVWPSAKGSFLPLASCATQIVCHLGFSLVTANSLRDWSLGMSLIRPHRLWLKTMVLGVWGPCRCRHARLLGKEIQSSCQSSHFAKEWRVTFKIVNANMPLGSEHYC